MGKINDNTILDNIKSLAYDINRTNDINTEKLLLSTSSIMYSIIKNNLIFDLEKTFWINRDRLIITDNRLSSLYYSVMYYLTDDYTIEDLQNYNYKASKTPYGLSYDIDNRIELTSDNMTLATTLGIAMSSKTMEEAHKRKKDSLFGFDIYALCTDETVLNLETLVMADKYNLDNIIIIYNCLKEEIKNSVLNNYEANGFKIIEVKNKDNVKDIDKAIDSAHSSRSLIVIDSTKYKDDIKEIKKYLGYNKAFTTNQEAYLTARDYVKKRLSGQYNEWAIKYKNYLTTLNDGDKKSLISFLNEEDISLKLDKIINHDNIPVDKPMSYINYQLMNIISKFDKRFINASSSFKITGCLLKNKGIYSDKNYLGYNIEFSSFESIMGSIMNGYALNGYRPFISAPLSKVSEMLCSIRSSAMMNLPVIYVFTHDTFMGYDNNLEAPINEISILRTIPNLDVYRPCDFKELMGCYNIAIETKKPSVIIVSDKPTDTFKYTTSEEVKNGGYVLSEVKNRLDLILLSSGSEIGIAMRVKKELVKNYIEARVVSVVNLNSFVNSDINYLESVIPKGYKCMAIEFSNDNSWYKLVGKNDLISLDSFIPSGSNEEILEFNELDLTNIIMRIKNSL